MNTTTANFAAVFAALFTAHTWADHCWQTDYQAARKGRPEPGAPEPPTGAESWRALLAHVGTYHLIMAVMLGVTATLIHLPLNAGGAAAGIGFSAASHTFWDRRWPIKAWMRATGSPGFAETSQGRYSVDQAQHVFCLWISAVLIVLL